MENGEHGLLGHNAQTLVDVEGSEENEHVMLVVFVEVLI